MAAMLSKFRIDFSDVIVITDITQKPNENTRQYFDTLTQKFLKNEHGASKLTCFFFKFNRQLFRLLQMPESLNLKCLPFVTNPVVI